MWAKPRAMHDLTAKRTLVKSPPELWSELSEVERLARHLGAFGEIRITRLEPEHTVAWEGEAASGTVMIEPSGWGTKVTLKAQVEGAEPGPAEPGPAEPEPAEPEPEPEPAEPELEPQAELFPEETGVRVSSSREHITVAGTVSLLRNVSGWAAMMRGTFVPGCKAFKRCCSASTIWLPSDCPSKKLRVGFPKRAFTNPRS